MQAAGVHSRTSKSKKTQYQDAYAIRQAAAHRAATLARTKAVRAKRLEDLGDPIRGGKETTAFVKSLDVAMDLSNATSTPMTGNGQDMETMTKTKDDTTKDQSPLSPAETDVAKVEHMNHFLTPKELASSLGVSKELTAPYTAFNSAENDPDTEIKAKKSQDEKFERSTIAIARITAVENTSSRQRTLINTRRCIEEFGRHNTDGKFRPHVGEDSQEIREERVGPDTGSSEVQIAILTAKIRVLAAEFEGRSRNDKVNKRNLRLLLHRRQKLLKYLQRKDRGGERWQHLIETLGLTPATWLGEINLQ